MATSITELQLEPNLRVFRKCEIKRRSTSVDYETNWEDVSNLVTRWPTIKFSLDTIDPFKYQIGQANMTFLSDDKQFSAENFVNSKFFGYSTRYKTLCRISTGLEDESGTQYPSTTSVFVGLFSDDIVDDEITVEVTVNSVAQALAEFNASNIAPSVTGVALTSAQILQNIRDYTPAGAASPLISPFFSTTQWLLTSTGRTYTIPTTTALDGKSGLKLIEELALAENYVFYIDNQGNIVFKDRNYSGTSDYNFNGPGRSDVNIISLNSVNEGVYKIYNKFSCQLFTNTIVSTQESFSFGDTSGVSLYGQREYSFKNDFVSTNTAGSTCSDLLSYHSVKKQEIDIDTKYITQLKLQQRVTTKYLGEITGDGSLWGYATWGKNLWSGHKGSVKINGDYGITGISINMEGFRTKFNLREV